MCLIFLLNPSIAERHAVLDPKVDNLHPAEDGEAGEESEGATDES